jgi:hypothetical protein
MKDAIRLVLFRLPAAVSSLLFTAGAADLWAAETRPGPEGFSGVGMTELVLLAGMFLMGAVSAYVVLRVRLRARSRELLTVLAELRRKNNELEAEVEERQQMEKDKERLIQELKEALENLRKLRGLLPICAYCKKIRDDKGYWNQLESYMAQHADVSFTHSICPECSKKIYEELQAYKDAEAKKKAAAG